MERLQARFFMEPSMPLNNLYFYECTEESTPIGKQSLNINMGVLVIANKKRQLKWIK